MPVCSYCGDRFNLRNTRDVIDDEFGDGVYDDAFPDGDACEDCARDQISSDIDSGDDSLRLNGNWYNNND